MPFDLVVTVCDDAAENCPLWLGRGRRVHAGFPDPAKVTGGDARKKLAAFRQVSRRYSAANTGGVERQRAVS